MAHAITVQTALNTKLLFSEMTTCEEMGRLFLYKLRLLGTDAQIKLPSLLGTPMTVKLKADDGYERYFNGIVSGAAQTGFQTIDKLRMAVYEFTVVPKAWLLTQKRDCRIYTDKTVPEIVKEVLNDVGYTDVKLSLTATYSKRPYCVQYREDCFNFISRLMEEEGIYYFFQHSTTTHTMVLADALGAHSAAKAFSKIPFSAKRLGSQAGAAGISVWASTATIQSTQYQLTDYDPLKPRESLLVTERVGDAKDSVSGLDIFDFPGDYTAEGKAADGTRFARVRIEALNVPRVAFSGETDACGLATGNLFSLVDFPVESQNAEYLVISAEMRLAEGAYASGGNAAEPFSCAFKAIEAKHPFRSVPTATKPQIIGLQTAVVSGESAEDINVDKDGQIEVTFHWNKPEKKDAKNSCRVRVASTWAGKQWGAISIPRVGQEVVVSFLEGDPDRPLVIGSVYNADNMPPYALPDNKTQSGIKSRSLKGGADDYNEFRFEDKKGSEQVVLHAQKDHLETVENDHTVSIGNDEKESVKHDLSREVGNNETVKVTKDRTHQVIGKDALTVNETLTVTVLQDVLVKSNTSIKLVAGLSSIELKQDGTINIEGLNVKVHGTTAAKLLSDVQTDVSGTMTNVKATAILSLEGSASLAAKSDGATQVQGTMLQLQGTAIAQLSGGIMMLG